MSTSGMRWPQRFLWGVSTSAHQYDGNNVASDYWAIEHLGVPIFAEPSGDALNSYHLWRDDMRLAAELGFTGYRFSVEWARIEPAPGQFSYAELHRYRSMVEHCRGLGLEPVVTLHHITHPAWFTVAGGWTADGAADRFAAYVEFAAPALAGVRWVTTINEPNYLATLGGFGEFLRTDDAAALYRSMSRHPDGVLGAATLVEPGDAVVEALVEAHRAARDTLRQRSDAAVGWSIAAQAFRPAGADAEATCARLTQRWEDRFLSVARDDDWLGVQSYTSQPVGPDGPVDPGPDAELTQLGWEFRPDALGLAVRHAAAIAPQTPIIVTENGIPTADDTRRIAFIDHALNALHAAVDDGIDVRGYFHWSFIDNFEWTLGYAPRFGLVAVDRRTFTRTPKPSAHHLGALARTAMTSAAGSRAPARGSGRVAGSSRRAAT